LYPDYYERIVALFHERNIRLSPSGFTNPPHLKPRQTDEPSNTHLQRLKQAAANCPPHLDNNLFQTDFEKFYHQLLSFLSIREIREIRGHESLLKRDLSSQHWYRQVFADPSTTLHQVIVRCPETEIIESLFDWAGLLNQHYRKGVEYYKELQPAKGHFYNLIVYEATDNGFSLYDMNEPDYTLLQLLSEPLSVNELLDRMQVYFEDTVLQNHYEEYKNLIFTSLKQLVLMKAVKPV
jgi:hypothetical protein